MTERVNRRDLILHCASELFLSQGYSATSIRQISDAAGVTEAAIYYHFKDGKRGLLQSVVECEMPDMMSALDGCEDIDSLHELVTCLLSHLAETGREKMDRIRWFIVDAPNMTDEERALFYNKHLKFHAALAKLVEPFRPRNASMIAWIIITALFGYGHTFWNLGLESVVYVSPEQFIAEFADLFAD